MLEIQRSIGQYEFAKLSLEGREWCAEEIKAFEQLVKDLKDGKYKPDYVEDDLPQAPMTCKHEKVVSGRHKYSEIETCLDCGCTRKYDKKLGMWGAWGVLKQREGVE